MLDKQLKQEIIEKFRQHEGDTGSTQVQIAILSEEIKQLTEHLQKHRHDFSSRRGLLRKVSERRRLLKYLQKEDEPSFIDLATKLNLKIAKKMAVEEEERKRLEAELMTKGEVDNPEPGEDFAEELVEEEI
jgi:small subunit ribosomal protein S15